MNRNSPLLRYSMAILTAALIIGPFVLNFAWGGGTGPGWMYWASGLWMGTGFFIWGMLTILCPNSLYQWWDWVNHGKAQPLRRKRWIGDILSGIILIGIASIWLYSVIGRFIGCYVTSFYPPTMCP